MKYPKSKECGNRFIKCDRSSTNKLREKKRQQTMFDLVQTVHESELANTKPDIQPDHRFEVTLEPDDFTEEKFKLFDNYQRHVHHEGDKDISRMGFRRFLCASPLHRHDIGSKKVGSFHQMYRLDGRLIAMGVLDLAPQAVSGVYFIYHSDFEKWSFGKLSALREAALAIEGEYVYYYMGYYIHNCKKMRYKGDYKPYVLDYDTMQWDQLDDEMRALMDKRKWVSMSRERTIQKESRLSAQVRNEGSEDSEEMSDGAFDEEFAARMYAVEYPDPVAATNSELSVLDLRMPSPMPLAQLLLCVDLDKMKVIITRGTLHEAQDLVGWVTSSETDMTTLKGIFAEFAACVGPSVARDIVVDLGREPFGA